MKDDHDCDNCPADKKSECKEFNDQKIDNFNSMSSKMKELILKSSESISIHGDKDAYHYFNELKAFIQAQMDLMFCFGWISKDEIERSDEICHASYEYEMLMIEEVRKIVNPDSKKR